MKTIKELNTRQWNLYEFLKLQTDWLFSKDIVFALDYTDARMLRSDIRKLRECDVIKKTVMNDCSLGFKIAASREKELEYFARRRMKLDREEKLYSHELNKTKLDGQTVIQFTGYEKDTIETINRKEID